MQTLVGGAVATTAPTRAASTASSCERVFPSNLMRTWHLQTAIFWIATAYVAAALFLGRSLRTDEPRWLAGLDARAVRRLRGGHRRQSARRVAGDLATARALVVLAWRPGLGIPGARPALAVPAGGRPVRMVRAAVDAGAARARWPSRGAAASSGCSWSPRWRFRSSMSRRCSSAPGPTSPWSIPGASGSFTCGSRASSSSSPPRWWR